MGDAITLEFLTARITDEVHDLRLRPGMIETRLGALEARFSALESGLPAKKNG